MCHLIANLTKIFLKETAGNMHDLRDTDIFFLKSVFHLIKSPVYILYKYSLHFSEPVSGEKHLKDCSYGFSPLTFNLDVFHATL